MCVNVDGVFENILFVKWSNYFLRCSQETGYIDESNRYFFYLLDLCVECIRDRD